MTAKSLLLSLCLIISATAGAAQDLGPRGGWVVLPTQKTYGALIDAVKTAVKANGMGVVTQAGPTKAAANRGITIPGNRVIGVFNNDFAVKVLALSTAAMIEAPIRMYVTENADGTATLSYKTPSLVFAPYMDEGGDALGDVSANLDDRFLTIATQASK